MSVDRDGWTGHAPEVEELGGTEKISLRRWVWVILVAVTTWLVWRALDGSWEITVAG